MNKNNYVYNDEVLDLASSILQDYFRIRMEKCYGSSWINEVENKVSSKFDTNDEYKNNYESIHKAIDMNRPNPITERDMDVTSLCALMVYDYVNQLDVNLKHSELFLSYITKIRDSRNWIQHLNDQKNIPIKTIDQFKALEALNYFLEFWKKYDDLNSNVIPTYLKQIQDLEIKLSKDIYDIDNVNKIRHLNSISELYEINKKEYIPLSYKIDDANPKRFNLDELFNDESNSCGFVIYSKQAGYGKTWSIENLSGRYAQKVLDHPSDDNPMPILIRMGELTKSDNPIIKAVQELLFPLDTDFTNTKSYINKEHVLLFVDGMDEADKYNKDSARKEIKSLLSTAQNLRIIGASRESDVNYFPNEMNRFLICDLTDKQIEEYLEQSYCSSIITKEQKDIAFQYYFGKINNAEFIKNLKSPFYLKMLIGFIKEGEANPTSDTDIVKRCLDKMIEREIKEKHFRIDRKTIDNILKCLSKIIGNDRRYVEENYALKELKANVIYDNEEYASIPQIINTLNEIQILKIIDNDFTIKIGFWHEKYKSIYSEVAFDINIWDF